MMDNFMKLQFLSKSENESFARIAVASFIAQLDPTLEELNDIKTVVSEAVTNSIIHGYDEDPNGIITISVLLNDDNVEIKIMDNGKGIDNMDEAVQPLFTTKPELERSGMGFTIMENMMDEMLIETKLGEGTTIILKKQLTFSQIIN